jgi:[protein-PII] uridylyltransferase
MSGGDSSPARSTRIDDTKHALDARLKNLSDSARQRALSRHYDSYWLAFDTDELEFHARLMQRADEKNEKLVVGSRSEISGAVTEIVIYTADHPGLFSRLAGAISVSNGSIVGAKIFTTSDGYALDVFQVQDASGGPFGDGGRIERLRQTILKTLAGEIRPRDVLAKRTLGRRAAAFKTQPKVNFDNEASTVSTLIEVESLDRVGLLYEITRSLFGAGMTISSAIIATYGELAVDTFYVRDVFGHKVIHPHRLAAIEARLMKALNG